jgi:hypothetical protein
MNYQDLSLEQQDLNELQLQYYRLRYKHFQNIKMLQATSPLLVTFHTFSKKCRSDCNKRKNKGDYGKRPYKFQLDHHIPLLYFFTQGIDDIAIINHPLNMKWISRKANIKKGIQLPEDTSQLLAQIRESLSQD